MPAVSVLRDAPRSFGWISIAGHWLTAVLIIVMWFLGKSIHSQPPGDIDSQRQLHVYLGLSIWALLAFRIAWRIYSGHPHAAGQTSLAHRVARSVHYVMLGTLAVMIVSGPANVLLRGRYDVFADTLQGVHALSSNLLMALIVLHILGALKHLMFHHDETIVRMLWPAKNAGAAADTAGPAD